MMGARGPIPKGIERRVGHLTKEQRESTRRVEMDTGPVKAPPFPRNLHPLARRWLQSLKESGQSAYYEPSDWAAALYVAEHLSLSLDTGASSSMFKAVFAAMATLGTTAESRKRMGINVGRKPRNPEQTQTTIDDYRRRLTDPEAYDEERRLRLLAEGE